MQEITDEARLTDSNSKTSLLGRKDDSEAGPSKKDTKKDKKPATATTTTAEKKCTHCNKAYHVEYECWDMYPHLKEQKLKDKQKNKGMGSNNADAVLLTVPERCFANPSAYFHSRWYNDTGSSAHMANDWTDSLPETYNAGVAPNLITGKGNMTPDGSGTARNRVQNSNGKTRWLTLLNTVYCPSFPVKIFAALNFMARGRAMDGDILYSDRQGTEISPLETIEDVEMFLKACTSRKPYLLAEHY